MMLLILLISRKLIFGENLSFARVAGDGIEGCVVGTGVSCAASTLWRLALVPDDDWEADSAVVMNGSLKASRKMNKSFSFLRNFRILWYHTCTRTGDQ
jgi:hypothetical protein